MAGIRDSLSWHWMFWNSAVIVPVMLACIYFGIPAHRRLARKGGPVPSFAGFLYLSFGLAMVFAALQQGERLDSVSAPEYLTVGFGQAFSSCCVR